MQAWFCETPRDRGYDETGTVDMEADDQSLSGPLSCRSMALNLDEFIDSGRKLFVVQAVL